MEKIGLFFGTDTGNTESVANLIAEKIGTDKIEIFDLQNIESEEILNYSKIIFGAPTWYDGELQSDWETHYDNFDDLDFTGKTIALYGLGDQAGYGEYFLDALGIIYDKLVDRGAKIVGQWPCQEYDFLESKAQRGDNFVGLGIDEDNESDLTSKRVVEWLEIIKPEMGF